MIELNGQVMANYQTLGCGQGFYGPQYVCEVWNGEGVTVTYLQNGEKKTFARGVEVIMHTFDQQKYNTAQTASLVSMIEAKDYTSTEVRLFNLADAQDVTDLKELFWKVMIGN